MTVNKLQDFMKEWISLHQNAFVKGRRILDNIFLVSEIMNYIHRAKTNKSIWCALKIDIQKDFDKLSWNFLKVVMRKMDFLDDSVHILMKCAKTVYTPFSSMATKPLDSPLKKD